MLGVCGGVAAYKAPDIVRRLQDRGAEVRVVMTRSACEFVRPLTFQAVSGEEVLTELLDERAEAAMGHIELARWADLVLIAPATANTLAKIAAGIADDLLTTLVLATRSPVLVAPSMNNAMWENAATQSALRTLIDRSVEILGPASGAQACGEYGPGRMLEPLEIADRCEQSLPVERLFQPSIKIVITAGPTREDIDPVRFISNHSSGKMGYALAAAALRAGAQVTLVSGPVRLDAPAGARVVDVVSARQMHEAVISCIDDADIFIAVAAVADYRVADLSDRKIKKTQGQMSLQLERNPDILADVASRKHKPFCVGFAAETHQVADYARDKLKRKNLDMIVSNRVGVDDGGFNSDHNAVEVFWSEGSQAYSSQGKGDLAIELIALIADRYPDGGES